MNQQGKIWSLGSKAIFLDNPKFGENSKHISKNFNKVEK